MKIFLKTRWTRPLRDMTRDPVFMAAFLTNTLFLIGTWLEMRDYKKRQDLF